MFPGHIERVIVWIGLQKYDRPVQKQSHLKIFTVKKYDIDHS